MKKSNLVDAVQAELQCGPNPAKAIVEDFLALIEQGVAEDGKTTLSGFGTFERKHRDARMARDVARNQAVALPERNVVVFRAAPSLRQDIVHHPAGASDHVNPE